MLNGSFTWAFATQGMRRLVAERANQLRHSAVPRYEFEEIINNIAAAIKQQPTTAYLTYMIAIHPELSNNAFKAATVPRPSSAGSSPFLILLAIHFRPEPVS